MCGIAGIISAKSNEQQIHKALASMAYRGPDSRGIYSDEPLTLLHTRLAIQDLSSSAKQPMCSADGRYTIIYNGELYNQSEIRNSLTEQGYSFRTHSDTETLLYGFAHFGTDILPMLNGIFAFAVYDKQNRELYLARDEFGVKPLYYYAGEGVFAFASELKTLMQLTTPGKAINPNALFQTLMLQWQLGADTGFKEIKKLLPGHAILISIPDPAQPQISKWSKEYFNGQYDEHSEAQWIERLNDTLNKAVRRQLYSDKPIAYFLSGGLDSSLLLAIAHKIDPGKPKLAFTIDPGHAFSTEGFGADLPYAKMVARHLNIGLEIIETKPDFIEDFDAMIYQLDEAQADIAPLFVRQIAKAAKSKGYDVLISGTGGDDVFSGYRRHQALAYESTIKYIPLLLRKAARYLVSVLPEHHKTRRLKKFVLTLDQPALQRMFGYFFWNDKKNIEQLFTQAFLTTIDTGNIEHFFSGELATIPAENQQLNQMLQLEMKSFLPNHNLNYTDKMGMAESVEIRVPYLDQELVALASKIPPSLKMKGVTTKYLLKKVAEKYLPEEVIYRSKTGFGAPVRIWMQEDTVFQHKVLERLERLSRDYSSIFNPAAITQLYQNTICKKADNTYTLLSLIAIESWLRQFNT